jgi:hypothetical protein
VHGEGEGRLGGTSTRQQGGSRVMGVRPECRWGARAYSEAEGHVGDAKGTRVRSGRARVQAQGAERSSTLHACRRECGCIRVLANRVGKRGDASGPYTDPWREHVRSIRAGERKRQECTRTRKRVGTEPKHAACTTKQGCVGGHMSSGRVFDEENTRTKRRGGPGAQNE